MNHSQNSINDTTDLENESSNELKLKQGSAPYRLLAFLRERNGKWISTADIFGNNKVLPASANYIPAKLFKNGWIDKKKDGGRSVLTITQAGIDQLAITEKCDLAVPIKHDAELIESKPAASEAKEYATSEIELSGIVRDRNRILKFLFYENALSVDSAVTPHYISNKLNILVAMVNAHLKRLVDECQVLKNNTGGYYLTREGIPAAEALILGGDEFIDDTLEAFLLNPLGRKVLHIIAEGMTVNQIAEKIGYNVESTFYDDKHNMNNEMEYGLKKTYYILDRLYRHGLIELAFHQVEKSTQITKINRPDVINILRIIAILIEYIPSLLIENDQYYSILRWLVNPAYQKAIDKQLKLQFYDINSVPEELRRKVAYAERCAYWLNVDKLEEEAPEWRDAGIVKNAGKHYYMVKRKSSKRDDEDNSK